METRMEYREDPSDSVVEEIASILASGYLRLRGARTLPDSGGVTPPPEPPSESEERLDSAPEPSPHGAVS